MAKRRLKTMDVREIIRQLQLKESVRAVSRRLSISRNTVKKYRLFIVANDLLKGPLPENSVLEEMLVKYEKNETPSQTSKVAPYREVTTGMYKAGLTTQVIFQRLQENHKFAGSYSSVLRFVRSELTEIRPEAFIRIEVAPGSQAQADFGYAGLMFDPQIKKLRKSWGFSMVLSHSRHQFDQFVFDQKVETWLDLHRQAFAFFGGVPKEIVIDNLKAGITKAAFYDPLVQKSYRQCAEHYGFIISPCRPATPRHKGKVECGGIKYLKNNFLAGRSFRNIQEANEKVLTWCLETAGKRIHGTTRQVPLEVFDKSERQALLPLPVHPYEIITWKEAKLHPDCHITFEASYYSAPFRLIGQSLVVAASDKEVRIFHDHQLVATHQRATRRGEWKTILSHLPPDKASYYLYTPVFCREQARKIGPKAEELITDLLGERPLNRLRAVQGILRMTQKYGPERLEAACRRALFFDELSYRTIKRILVNNLDKEGMPVGGRLPFPEGEKKRSSVFARPWSDFFPDSVPRKEELVITEKEITTSSQGES